MTGNEVRRSFLEFFAERGHRVVKSASLVPDNDPTLLFTNAGMNQFKDVFLGQEKRVYNRAATSQKCMRVSGKHNDLETVGRTARHHTFFEMLGNFSFGDYFKKDAIAFAWELLTGQYGLDKKRLRITVFREDDDAFQIWHKGVGIQPDWIFRLDEADNFWAMGDTGPCGPCSEIHYDLGVSPAGHADCDLTCSCGRWVEIWNLVFMQFNRDPSGAMTPLPRPSIDTGMGLERITSILQGKLSNYDTDLFTGVIDETCQLAGKTYGENADDDTSLRIIADHSRAACFVIGDGVLPANEGRGYVLRKIIRRALRHGKRLGLSDPFLFRLTAHVASTMKEAYPENEESREYVSRVVLNEEEKFSSTLEYGLRLIEDVIAKQTAGQRSIPGAELFKLYDTYGFPLDLAREIAEERGLELDEAGFQREMDKQRERARASWKGGEKVARPLYQKIREEQPNRFIGYDQLQASAKILAIVQDDARIEEIGAGGEAEVVIDPTPFYAESGGQVGDRGTVETDEALARVIDCFSPVGGLNVARVRVERGKLRSGDIVQCSVSLETRRSTARNHTATHLMHAALREELGEHVKQAGSLVAPDRLRFDFTHFAPMNSKELDRIEERVNREIRDNYAVETRQMPIEEALTSGALAFFGDKYGEQVRVVGVGDFSKELCGGTHVHRGGDIGVFKVVAEGGIAAGVRRIEAITGAAAVERFIEDDHALSEVASALRVTRPEILGQVERIAVQLKEAHKQLESLQLKLASLQSRGALDQAREVKGVKVLARRVENVDRNNLRVLADRLRTEMKSGVVVLGSPVDGKVSLVVMVSSDLVPALDASKLIRDIAPIVGGGGGGKPELAEAGGKDPSRLDEALQATYAAVEKYLG
ncbi:MAG: alanine--tRNA ligase [Acidobacteriota bacterium]